MNTKAGKTESFVKRRARLRQSFLAQIPDRLRLAREQIAELNPAEYQEEQLKKLHLLFHTLKGSGSSFGFQSIYEVAQVAEQALRETLDQKDPVSINLINELKQQVDLLEKLERERDFDLSGRSDPNVTCWIPAQYANFNEKVTQTRLVYLCDDDQLVIHELADQLACFGYQVIPFTKLDELRAAIVENRPTVVIMDVVFPEGQHAGPDVMREINATLASPVPSIFISVQDDFLSRLRAVQAGSSAYCPKPVKSVEIVEVLDRLTARTSPEPFHILVVDDEPDVARLHALALEEAGMVVRVVTEPERVPAMLDHFDADLVLLDLYMPLCSGPELAQVLRQIPGYLALPIIYVSAETQIDRQFRALAVGADGFLTKPIDPTRLVAEVHLRAERMRTLRSLMIRDSLTGLFNHNTILQLLEVALATARRAQTGVSLAMIDVDLFKNINDTHGHQVGDQVLMALSRTLRLRLRETDLVGRYGGEEFAVLLVGLDARQAWGLIDALRASFATVTFLADGVIFHCTFSAGVAAFPEFNTPSALLEAADRALYQAKQSGRNRVELLSKEDVAT